MFLIDTIHVSRYSDHTPVYVHTAAVNKHSHAVEQYSDGMDKAASLPRSS